VLLLVMGYVAAALGVDLARLGYVSIRKRPYAASNGRLLSGAVLVGMGIALIILGTAILTLG
jgi:hypothetical protein